MQRYGSTKGQVNGISTVSEKHLFYMNPKDNNIKPPWYINCSRKEAEEILKKHREYGNVLLRPNSNFAINGSYALSAVTISSGDDKYVHYVISRATNGFKLEVQSKPAPMACLQDVLDYYITAAGCQTHHAMVIDPTEASKGKTVCRNPIGIPAKKNTDYVNFNESTTGHRTSAPIDEEIYLPMSGGSNGKKSHDITRRCSAPVNKRDYVNMPKATGANISANDHYINGKELDLNESRGRDGHDYINVANVIPGRNPRSPMSKASSFPLPRKEGFDDDDDDDDYDSPTYLAPEPPIFSQDIRPSSIHEPPGY